MNTETILSNLREKHGLTQDKMAEKLLVTRQAVSRWENGETVPNTETLKLISKEFNISINTLLGSPQHLVCQCCGMPLEDETTSRESDGSFNESYCKWCYTEGLFVYQSLEELMTFLVPHLAKTHGINDEDIRKMLEAQLPNLKHWTR